MTITATLAGCAGGPGQWESYGVDRPGGVEGVLTDGDGRPVEGAEVYFYTDPARKFRGPAEFMAEPTGPDGRYITELPPGRYWAVARKRASGSISGNLQKGDLYTREAAGPLDVADGRYQSVDMELVELTGNMLFSVFAGGGSGQAVKGVIRERDGTPKPHAYAFAYKDARMAGKPDYVSEWTRDDGVYTLYLPEPGVYYVGARTGFMGVPRPDEPYGKYSGAKDHSVSVPEGGVVEGVDVTLGRFSGSR
ncbi:MAG: carboxypeptidase regulatory-like domain-containing protein [Nitrospirae bacterium]|nr:carboxypeptidase regulatory-like domain-containing protein [Nitrospirota bacterium]